MKPRKGQPSEPKIKILATVTVASTGETWTIRDVDGLRVFGKVEREDEVLALDPIRREILLPDCYDVAELGAAVWTAINGID